MSRFVLGPSVKHAEPAAQPAPSLDSTLEIRSVEPGGLVNLTLVQATNLPIAVYVFYVKGAGDANLAAEHYFSLGSAAVSQKVNASDVQGKDFAVKVGGVEPGQLYWIQTILEFAN